MNGHSRPGHLTGPFHRFEYTSWRPSENQGFPDGAVSFQQSACIFLISLIINSSLTLCGTRGSVRVVSFFATSQHALFWIMS